MNAPVRFEDLELATRSSRSFYLSIRVKFAIALSVALCWTGFSVFLAQAWMRDLALLTTPLFALLLVTSR